MGKGRAHHSTVRPSSDPQGALWCGCLLAGGSSSLSSPYRSTVGTSSSPSLLWSSSNLRASRESHIAAVVSLSLSSSLPPLPLSLSVSLSLSLSLPLSVSLAVISSPSTCLSLLHCCVHP